MAQNYAKAINPHVVERFKLKSLTDTAFSTNYKWEGVKTIGLYGIDLPTMNDYDRNATSNRFGTPEEVGTTLQELTLTRDRGKEQVVDFGNLKDSMEAQKAKKHLYRVVDEVITPEIDIYRLSVAATAAETNSNKITGEVTKANAYETFLDLNEKISNSLAPQTNRVAWVTYSYLSKLKAGDFVMASEAGMNIHKKGVIGYVDGVAIVPVPTSYMPANVDIILAHQDSLIGPVKLANYRVLDGQQGYDGNILQWRYYYDAFVLKQKLNAIAVHKTA